jgi:hypothetical protein
MILQLNLELVVRTGCKNVVRIGFLWRGDGYLVLLKSKM